MVAEDVLIEHKFAAPQTGSIGVQRAWLSKVTEGARRKSKVPAMVLTFEAPEGHEKDWVLIPLSLWLRTRKLA